MALNVLQLLTHSLGDPVQVGNPILRYDARRAPIVLTKLSEEIREKNGTMEECSEIVKVLAEFSFDVISVIQPSSKDVHSGVMRDLALDIFQFTQYTFAKCGRD